MKHNLKLTGRLRNYLILPIFLTILLVILNIPIYFVNQEAGVMVSGFLVVYVVCMFASFLRNQPVLVKEVINFATQYSTVQKKLLNEFEIPYALLDINGKILWMNNKFTVFPRKSCKREKGNLIFISIGKIRCFGQRLPDFILRVWWNRAAL